MGRAVGRQGRAGMSYVQKPRDCSSAGLTGEANWGWAALTYSSPLCVCSFVCLHEGDDKIGVLPVIPPAVTGSLVELLAVQLMGKWVGENSSRAGSVQLSAVRLGSMKLRGSLFLSLHALFYGEKLKKERGRGKARVNSMSLVAWGCGKMEGKEEGKKILWRGTDGHVNVSVLWFRQGCNLSKQTTKLGKSE